MTIWLVFERRFRDESPLFDTAWDSEQAAIGHIQIWIQTKPRPLGWQEVPLGSSTNRRIWTNGDQDLILEPTAVLHGSWMHGIEEEADLPHGYDGCPGCVAYVQRVRELEEELRRRHETSTEPKIRPS